MSAIEDELAWQLQCAQISFEREFKFHPTRQWRADFKIGSNILVEVEGLVYRQIGSEQSRHTTITGYTHDCEKYNEAQLLGYKILRFTQEHIANGSALKTIERAISTSINI